MRKPNRKRSKKNIFPLFTLVGSIILLLLTVTGAILYFSSGSIVSPLPETLGFRLPVVASEPDGEAVEQLLLKQGIQSIKIEQTSDSYVISLNEKQQIVLSKKKDVSEQISSLQVLLPRLTMEGREFRTLDLRFDKPVVTY